MYGVEVRRAALPIPELRRLLTYVCECVGPAGGDPVQLVREGGVGHRDLALHVRDKEADPSLVLVAIEISQVGDHKLGVAFEVREGVVGNSLRQHRRGGPDESVALFDVGVEEAQGFARLQCLQPERHLGQLYGHRVEVDAVDAVGDYLPHRRSNRLGCRLGVTLTHGGYALGDAPRRRD